MIDATDCALFFQADSLPKVVDNDYDFGFVHSDWFGGEIKITCSVCANS